MIPTPIDDQHSVRSQIAVAAARLIAQDGADYDSAKRKAAHQLLGAARQDQLPDDAQVEAEVRQYQALFQADTQPARLAALRVCALQVMTLLERFSPYLTGAVLHGTAGAHDDIELQLFTDSAKEVEIFLLNQNLQLDIGAVPQLKGGRHAPVETVSFMWGKEGVHAQLYDVNDLRGAKKRRADGRLARADLAGVRALLSPTTESS